MRQNVVWQGFYAVIPPQMDSPFLHVIPDFQIIKKPHVIRLLGSNEINMIDPMLIERSSALGGYGRSCR